MYCEKCGSLKQNGICPKCNNNDSNWVVFTVLKCIFIPLITSGVLFFVVTFISVLLNILQTANDFTVPTIISRGILPILQLGVPILIIMFGWVVILVIDLKKHKK